MFRAPACLAWALVPVVFSSCLLGTLRCLLSVEQELHAVYQVEQSRQADRRHGVTWGVPGRVRMVSPMDNDHGSGPKGQGELCLLRWP